MVVCGHHVLNGYTLAIVGGVPHPELCHTEEGLCAVCAKQAKWMIGAPEVIRKRVGEGAIKIPYPVSVSRYRAGRNGL